MMAIRNPLSRVSERSGVAVALRKARNLLIENTGVSARHIRVRNMDYEGKRKSKGRGFRDVRLEEFTQYTMGTAQNKCQCSS